SSLFRSVSAPHPHLHSFPTRRSSDLVTLKHFLESRVQVLIRESLEQPFSLLGRLLVGEPYLQNEVEFAAGSAAVNEASDRLLAKDRKSTRLNSSHVKISYAVFCLKKK